MSNHTEFTQEQINEMPLLKIVRSNWRQRNIFLHQHPTEENSIVSVGVFWDGSNTVICKDDKSAWTRELASPEMNVTTN